jgi:hypothetical protein
MIRLKRILSVLLAVAIAMAGIPVQAGASCPMTAQMQQIAKTMPSGKDCTGSGCAMTGKQESKKNGCCDNGTCTEKCSVLGGVTANMPSSKIILPKFTAVAEKYYVTEGVLPSHLLQTQDRPPKHLT